MKNQASSLWSRFRGYWPGKVQILILLVCVIVGVALWAGWQPDLDYFVVEGIVAVAFFVYAVAVSLELDDHLDRVELIGVFLAYLVLNFLVTYQVTGENVVVPVIGVEMAGAVPDHLQLGRCLVGIGIAGFLFNLLVDRDTSLHNLKWWVWQKNPVAYIILDPILRNLGEGMARWRSRINGLDVSFPKPSLPDRLRRQPQPDPASSEHKRPVERRPDERQREASSSE